MDNMDARSGRHDPAAPLPPSGVWTVPPAMPPQKPKNPAFQAGTRVSLLFLGALVISFVISFLLMVGAAFWDGLSGRGLESGGMYWLLYNDVGYQVMSLIVYAIPFLLAGASTWPPPGSPLRPPLRRTGCRRGSLSCRYG